MIFSKLIGHRRAKEMLSRALAHSTVHTGYLFTGPAGVGKHLAAQEFVRALLCLAAPGEACGVCASCTRVGGRTHQDLIEVTYDDKKKSIGIEQVRNLGGWLAQSPALGRRKAEINDPADA